MTDELLTKIQRVLQRQIRNEMQVVYLLVELRKLMDREKYGDPLLRTFCNWVVHTSLGDRREGSTLILTEFDEKMAAIHEGRNSSGAPRHLSLFALRSSLNKCFKHFKLCGRFVTTEANWKRFAKQYCSIVSDCPILFSASKTELKYVHHVELRKLSPGLLVRELPMLEWKVTFKDGHTQNWAFQMF